jgi:hypothetical protein
MKQAGAQIGLSATDTEGRAGDGATIFPKSSLRMSVSVPSDYFLGRHVFECAPYSCLRRATFGLGRSLSVAIRS